MLCFYNQTFTYLNIYIYLYFAVKIQIAPGFLTLREVEVEGGLEGAYSVAGRHEIRNIGGFKNCNLFKLWYTWKP